jgi:3D (Asp-Asp-Asp) domain-containing protein
MALLALLLFASASFFHPAAAMGAGIKNLSENLGEGSIGSGETAVTAPVCTKESGFSLGSIFSKIGGFFKNLFSGIKNSCSQAASGSGCKKSFLGGLFEKILSFFGLCGNSSGNNGGADQNSNQSSSSSSSSSQSSSASNDNSPATDGGGLPSTGTLASGESVQILEQSSGSYKIRKASGEESWICKKKIRTIPVSGDGSAQTSTADGGTSRGTGRVITSVKATGYYPPPPGGYKTKAEAAMEGGANDCRGNKLRTLQDYKPGSYVSCATDPRVIKTGTYFTIDEYPGIKFLACDVGGAIKGNHIDICCSNAKETYKVPSKITLRYL